MLALSDDGHSYRIREEVLEFKYEHGALYSRWQPMPHVEVETWLISIAPWHLRVHHIQTSQTIWTAEGAFAINREDDHPLRPSGLHESGQGFAWGRYPSGASGIRDLLGQCDGQNVYAEPNSNLIAQRTLLPTLTKQLDTGEHWLACAVLASTNVQYWQQMWEQVPNLPEFVEAMMSR